MTDTHGILEGLDPSAGAWGIEPALDPAIEAVRQCLEQGQLDDLGCLAGATPDDATTRRGLTRLLLLNFSGEAADGLKQAGRLDEDWLIREALDSAPRALAWACRDAQGVRYAETFVSEITDRRAINGQPVKQEKFLEPQLVRLAGAYPDDTMEGLLGMDLASVFERHASNDWRSWHHGGMRVLAALLVCDAPLNLDQLVRVADRMVSAPVLRAALGKDAARTEVQACQMEPLVKAAVGSQYLGSDITENLVALGRLDHLARHSKAVARLLDAYWALDSVPDKPNNSTITSFNMSPDPNRVTQLLPKASRAHNLIDCLVMMGRDCVKTAIAEGSPNGEVFWKALARRGNLHNFLRCCSSSEIVQLLPKMMEKLGEDWRDEAGNNLAHVVALATAAPEKQALMTLSRLPRGSLLFTQTNDEGLSPLDMTQTNPKWTGEAPDFHKRLAEQVARARKKDLTAVYKESSAARRGTRTHRSM